MTVFPTQRLTIPSVPVKLRDFRNSDFERLWKLDQDCFPRGISYTRNELMHYMTRRGAFTLVAEEGEFVLGFLVAQEDRRSLGHVITIDVHSGARRKGIGLMLMEAAEARLRERGCVGMYLETAVNNEPAITFYKRQGYAVLQTIPHYYRNDLDAFLMGKRFPPPAAQERAEERA
jgi:ribosomal-protein-alanine N-acetyltransferase